MDQITGIITSSAMSILVVLTGIVVQAIKKYLLMRGGKKAIEIVEILAKNAVNATEQVADKLDIHGKDKLEHAKTSLIEGLESQNIGRNWGLFGYRFASIERSRYSNPRLTVHGNTRPATRKQWLLPRKYQPSMGRSNG